MTFWCESESGAADPCLWLIDPDPESDPESDPDSDPDPKFLDPDPAIFVIDLRDAKKN